MAAPSDVKPVVRYTKRATEAQGLASEVILSLLNQKDDEIDLQFQAQAKRIRKHLNADETEELMDEIVSTVSRYVRVARHRANPPAPAAALGAPGPDGDDGDGPGAPGVVAVQKRLCTIRITTRIICSFKGRFKFLVS